MLTTTLATIAELPLLYKYALVAVALIVGGTPALIASIYLSLIGTLNIYAVGVLSLITTIAWDTIWYLLGHAMSYTGFSKFISKRFSERTYSYIADIYSKHPYKILFISRFIYGLGSAITVVSGHMRLNYPKFVLVVGGSIAGWFLLLTMVGLAIDRSLESFESVAGRVGVILPVFLIVIIGGGMMIRHYLKKYAEKANPVH